MDIAHIAWLIVGALLLLGSVGMLYCCCGVGGRYDDMQMQPPEQSDIIGPDLDPLGAFGEQVDGEAVGRR